MSFVGLKHAHPKTTPLSYEATSIKLSICHLSITMVFLKVYELVLGDLVELSIDNSP